MTLNYKRKTEKKNRKTMVKKREIGVKNKKKNMTDKLRKHRRQNFDIFSEMQANLIDHE